MFSLFPFHVISLLSHSIVSASLLLPLSLPLISPLSFCPPAVMPAGDALPSIRQASISSPYCLRDIQLFFAAFCRQPHTLLTSCMISHSSLLPLPTAAHTPYWLHDIPLFFTSSSGSYTYSLLAARYPALLCRPLPAAACLLHRLWVILPLLHSPYR